MGVAAPDLPPRPPKARPEIPAEAPRPTTGIDYLGLLDVAHTATLAGRVNYAALANQHQHEKPRP